MAFITDEQLQGVVRSLYYDSDNNPHQNVFETCDDAWLLVNVNKYERLVGQKTEASIDEIEESYGDEIIQRYLARQAQKHIDNKRNNMMKANDTHKKYADMRRVKIIALIIAEHTKEDIEESLNVSKSTINRALKGLDELQVSTLYSQYKDTLFAEVSWGSLQDFLSVGCSYKEYQKLLQVKIP